MTGLTGVWEIYFWGMAGTGLLEVQDINCHILMMIYEIAQNDCWYPCGYCYGSNCEIVVDYLTMICSDFDQI